MGKYPKLFRRNGNSIKNREAARASQIRTDS